YRLAVEEEPQFFTLVAREAARVVGGYDDALEIAPAGKTGDRMLDQLGAEVQSRLPSTRVRLDEEILRRDPTDPGPATRVADDAVEDLESGAGAPWCQGANWSACVTSALALANRAAMLEPERCEPHVLGARARIARGDGAAALKNLANASDHVTDRISCLQALVRLAYGAHDERIATEAIAQIANSECSDDAECAANLMWAAREEESRGSDAQALSLYKRAQSRDPDQDAPLEAIARLAAAEGLHAEAAETYGQLARRHPNDPQWKGAADAQRSEAIKMEVGL
ncbi:MAG: tetratricopeptide repeat protein, partial [Polyangiaceae bacterium]